MISCDATCAGAAMYGLAAMAVGPSFDDCENLALRCVTFNAFDDRLVWLLCTTGAHTALLEGHRAYSESYSESHLHAY